MSLNQKFTASLLFVTLLLTGCAHSGLRSLSASAIAIEDVPFFPQEEHQCGPAALATVLGWSGVEVTPDQLTPQVYMPARKGSLQAEMLVAPASHGRLAVKLPDSPAALLDELKSGHPVLVLQNLSLAVQPMWHYAVVVALEPSADKVTLRSGRFREHVMSWRSFLATWARADNWAMVTLRPGDVPPSATPKSYTDGVLALERAGQYAGAAAAYAAGHDYWPDEILMPFGLANMRYAQGDLPGAEQALRMALQLDPNATPVLNNLAQVLIEQGCPGLAVIYAERALANAGQKRDDVEKTLAQARLAQDRPAVCQRTLSQQDTL